MFWKTRTFLPLAACLPTRFGVVVFANMLGLVGFSACSATGETSEVSATGEDDAGESTVSTSTDGTAEESGTSGYEDAFEIRPGLGIGPIDLGMTYAQVRAAVGEAQAPFPSNRIVVVAYTSLGLELVFASPLASELTDDAVVLAVGAKTSGAFTGLVVPGTSRTDIEAALGVAPEAVGSYFYYPQGLSVRYVEDAAFAVGVVPAYTLDPVPPPMVPASLHTHGAAR